MRTPSGHNRDICDNELEYYTIVDEVEHRKNKIVEET